MAEPTSKVRVDFDRIALLSRGGWDHNAHYHGFLLSHIPNSCRSALDVGCGTGSFARHAAPSTDGGVPGEEEGAEGMVMLHAPETVIVFTSVDLARRWLGIEDDELVRRARGPRPQSGGEYGIR